MTDVVVTREAGVLQVHLDREAKRNALSDAMASAVCDALADPGDCRVVLLSSAGERVFCAGADLTVMEGDRGHDQRGGIRRVVEAMRACPLPVVARVQGLCLAGGVGIVLGADIVVAAESAAFALPEVDRGIWPFMVGVLMAEHVSPKTALDLMLTGRRIPAAQALSYGLVSRVVPDAGLDAEVDALVEHLAGSAPVAMREGKAAYWQVVAERTTERLDAMQHRLTALTATEDAAEGIAAFREKRPPRWRGR